MRPGWVRFESAHPLKVGQDSAGVDTASMRPFFRGCYVRCCVCVLLLPLPPLPSGSQ